MLTGGLLAADEPEVSELLREDIVVSSFFTTGWPLPPVSCLKTTLRCSVLGDNGGRDIFLPTLSSNLVKALEISESILSSRDGSRSFLRIDLEALGTSGRLDFLKISASRLLKGSFGAKEDKY